MAPKTFITTTINKEGNLIEKTETVYGRKIPLKLILEKENHRLHAAGVLRVNTDKYYVKLTQPELDKCLISLQDNHHCNTETKRNILKAIQRPGNIKLFGIKENKLAEVARHMGHELAVHRLQDDVIELAKGSKLLLAALVDGATLKWDYHDAFEGMTSNDIQELTREEVEKRKSEAMEKNAWTTAEQVRLRIDDKKGPAGDFLKAYLTEPLDNQFFTDRSLLMKYADSSKSKRDEIQGHGYFNKIFKYIDSHCEIGELYIEFRKCKQNSEACSFCTDRSTFPYVNPLPRPYPDYERLPDFHYLPIENTPILIDDQLRHLMTISQVFS
ncbi:unnamed protein product [Mytilus edulis]|uniref:Uncharacterized protein n=1 Tax=Mytilus edulis TaxID=6550 RepID=A0A8S3VRD1_MYTED|nr:unnamed protein product [Mytilus edulis]